MGPLPLLVEEPLRLLTANGGQKRSKVAIVSLLLSVFSLSVWVLHTVSALSRGAGSTCPQASTMRSS